MKSIKKFDNLVDIIESNAPIPGMSGDNEDDTGFEKSSLAEYPDDNVPVETVEGENIGWVNYTDAERIGRRCYDHQQSYLLYGNPGIGKSEILKSLAKKLAVQQDRTYIEWNKTSLAEKQELIANPEKYFILIDQRTARWDPTDLLGIPDIAPSDWLNMRPHMWVWMMTLKNSSGILFLDEVNQATPQVLKALFSVILDREIGNYGITDDWGVFAAGNLGHQFNDVIPLALTSRFAIAQLRPDPKTWLKWAYKNGVDDGIISFIESAEDENFYKLPEAERSANYPCPRSFVKLSNFISGIKKQYYQARKNGTLGQLPGIYYVVEQEASTVCGANWAKRFTTFLRYQREYDWATIVKTADKVIPNADIDKLHALVLVTRDTLNKYFDKNSELAKDKKAQMEFAKDFCRVFVTFPRDWRITLMNRINTKAKDSAISFMALLYTHAKEEPFKSTLESFVQGLADTKGE